MFDTRVESRLRSWARWWVEVEAGRDGYPKQSALSLFLDGALELRGEFRSIPLISNIQAGEFDHWLKRMSYDYPDFYEAIMLYYLSCKPAKEIANFLGISKRTFYARLDGARVWLSGLLSAQEG